MVTHNQSQNECVSKLTPLNSRHHAGETGSGDDVDENNGDDDDLC